MRKGQLQGYDGIIAPGGYGDRGAEGIVAAASYARTHKIPFFAIGYGMQLSVVAAVRDLLGISDANSTEVDPLTAHPVVRIPQERGDGERQPSGRTYGAANRAASPWPGAGYLWCG